MKTSIAITAVLVLSTLGTRAQGWIDFNIRVSGTVVGHVYGFEPTSLTNFYPYIVYELKRGNTAAETPAGTQVYYGPKLTGSGFSAALWSAPGAGAPEWSLVLVPGSLTTFRTGATLGGTPAPLVLAVPNVAIHATGTFQVRAWDNSTGASWGAALTRGQSDLFEVANLGDGLLDFPAEMVNFRSFNFGDVFIPKPTTTTVLGLGALGLWFFRRKKHAR